MNWDVDIQFITSHEAIEKGIEDSAPGITLFPEGRNPETYIIIDRTVNAAFKIFLKYLSSVSIENRFDFLKNCITEYINLIILHEIIHQCGVKNEKETNEAAIALIARPIPRWARGFIGKILMRCVLPLLLRFKYLKQ